MRDMPMDGAASSMASFLGPWLGMTAAMMLPSLVPLLWRYRRTLAATSDAHGFVLTALVGIGYAAVWTAFGLVAYPLGTVLPRATPLGVAVAVLLAGAWQSGTWKTRALAPFRRTSRDGSSPIGLRSALRHGIGLGLGCARSCANWMAIMLVAGVMDVRAMVVVGAVIAAERLSPSGDRVARAAGAVCVAAGAVLLVRAAA